MEIKLTKRQKYWLNLIIKHPPLVKYYNDQGNACFAIPNASERIRRENFGLETITKDMAFKLIAKGLVIPMNDGFFGDSQTYRAGSVD